MENSKNKLGQLANSQSNVSWILQINLTVQFNVTFFLTSIYLFLKHISRQAFTIQLEQLTGQMETDIQGINDKDGFIQFRAKNNTIILYVIAFVPAYTALYNVCLKIFILIFYMKVLQITIRGVINLNNKYSFLQKM